MEKGLFEKIIDREIPAEIIYENDHTIAFLDIHPCAIGHTLVIPKNKSVDILDINDQDISNVFKTVKKVSKMLKKSLNADGFSIGVNSGEAAQQGVPHFHVHIIPRFKNDGGGSMHTIVKNPSEESLSKVREIIEKKS